MQRISVSGKVAKRIFESLREQTEKKCENCLQYKCPQRMINSKCVQDSVNYKISFEQKSITLILSESLFKSKKVCGYFNEATEQCTSPNFDGCREGNKDCIWDIKVKQGDIIEFVCGECEGKGKLLCEEKVSCPCDGCPFDGEDSIGFPDDVEIVKKDCPYNMDKFWKVDCETCQGKGSFRLKVIEKIPFKVDKEFIDFPLGKNEDNLDKLTYILSLKLEDGEYVLFNVLVI